MVPRLIALTEVPVERPWLTVRFLRRLVAERRIWHKKLRNRIYFRPEDLDSLGEDRQALKGAR
jgi:hypothetical protein